MPTIPEVPHALSPVLTEGGGGDAGWILPGVGPQATRYPVAPATESQETRALLMDISLTFSI